MTSHQTETLHVRGVRRTRFLDAIAERMAALDHFRVDANEHPGVERTEPRLRRLVLRRDGRWLTFADGSGFDRRTYRADPPDADIEAWAQFVSRVLDRSVLTIWTSESEASVLATRWKQGKSRGALTLLRDAYRGSDGLPYSPAKVFRPWLPPDRRATILKTGIKLVTPSGGSTGDRALDAMLEGFDEADYAESGAEDEGGEHVFVSEDVSVQAIGAAIGMRDPLLNPWMPGEDDEEILFRPR